jgi:hypothetical protein
MRLGPVQDLEAKPLLEVLEGLLRLAGESCRFAKES